MQPLRPGGTEKKIDKKSQCIGSWYVTIFEIGKCKLKILFFQFSFFNYFARSLGERILHFIWRHARYERDVRTCGLARRLLNENG
ncbi:MAG: hypothetical protein COS94_04125 [Candidatus Hydrogenedentes bacterium CG07_land_8_20_14_0_80_42_17]|nr:MAG: hypothetical protein COS94_04125 [Candidatus Hydrogenedentes bacterium CG07_land_8_20_14_0_80_42_17]